MTAPRAVHTAQGAGCTASEAADNYLRLVLVAMIVVVTTTMVVMARLG